MGPAFQMIIRSGPTAGKAYPLVKNEIFIGRDLSNDIVINDPEVSRRHARLFVQSGNVLIEDLGSTNGSSVNGQRLVSPYALRPGEVITLGERITLLFETAEASNQVSPPTNDLKPLQPSTPEPARDSYQVQSSAYSPPPPAYNVAPPAEPTFNRFDPDPLFSSSTSAAQNYPSPAAGLEPANAPFTGQVPISGYDPAPQTKMPVWPYVVIGILLLIILVLVIDYFRLWCLLFGMC